jgi:S-adenosylmethionine synthetase
MFREAFQPEISEEIRVLPQREDRRCTCRIATKHWDFKLEKMETYQKKWYITVT